MSKKRTSVGIAALAVIAGVATCFAQGPASADFGPHRQDVVGVGSDASQSLLNLLAEGATVGGTAYTGYNETTAAAKWSVYNVDASSANGLDALVADSLTGKDAIDFDRSTTVPTPTQENTASNGATNINAYLDSIQIATDTQYIATTTTTNAPDVITPAELLAIYTGKVKTWGDLQTFRTTETGAPTGWTPKAPSNTIIAYLPPSTAGVQKIFFQGLQAANGGTLPTQAQLTANPNVYLVKQNEPTTLDDPSKAVNPTTGASYNLKTTQKDDVIVPIPLSKYNLFKAGYYVDGSKAYSQAAGSQSVVSVSDIKLENGTGAFSSTIQFNIVFRDSDLTSKTAWQPGSKLNWVQTLFFNTNAYAAPTYKPTKAQAKKHPKVTAPWTFGTQFQSILKQLGLTAVPFAQAFHPYSDAK